MIFINENPNLVQYHLIPLEELNSIILNSVFCLFKQTKQLEDLFYIIRSRLPLATSMIKSLPEDTGRLHRLCHSCWLLSTRRKLTFKIGKEVRQRAIRGTIAVPTAVPSDDRPPAGECHHRYRTEILGLLQYPERFDKKNISRKVALRDFHSRSSVRRGTPA